MSDSRSEKGSEPRSATRMTSEAVERDASRLLALQLAPRIDALCERWDAHTHEIEVRSSLYTDDRLTRPHELSRAVAHSISHATDNLQAVRDITVSGGGDQYEVVTRPFAVFPLLRAAYENACTATWLLAPSSRDERLTRRFRMLIEDGGHQDAVARLLGSDDADAKQRRRDRVRPIAIARGISMKECGRSASYAERARASEMPGLSSDTLEATWRTLSGLTHGDIWATLVMNDREQVELDPQGQTVTMSLTSSLANVANLTSITTGLVERAIAFYEGRRINHLRT